MTGKFSGNLGASRLCVIHEDDGVGEPLALIVSHPNPRPL